MGPVVGAGPVGESGSRLRFSFALRQAYQPRRQSDIIRPSLHHHQFTHEPFSLDSRFGFGRNPGTGWA
jgi:hypothetical protein